MKRREFIKTLASAALLGGAGKVFGQEPTASFAQGWTPNPRATEEFNRSLPAVYGDQVGALVNQDNNKDALLYRPLALCIKKSGLEKRWLKKRDGRDCVRSYHQGNVGSCTGNATAQVINVLSAVEIVLLEKFQEFTAVCSAEGAYGLGREAAGMLHHRGDGCYGSAMAKSIMQFGTLYCLNYETADLTEYDQTRCRTFGRNGVGDKLKTEAKKHPVKSTVRVNDADSAWALLGNGYPMNVCSDIGLTC